MDLKDKNCVPCEGGIPKLMALEADKLLEEIPTWERRGETLFKSFHFKKFMTAIEFVNRMAQVAEEEGHHPNIAINFREVDVTIWTHAIGGLSENDFILAAKIDPLAQ